MMDLVSAGAGAVFAYDAYKRLLGPTFDYLGETIKDCVAKRHQNVTRIFDYAVEKCEDRSEKGFISPRILKEVLDDGSFCEDELGAEYYGGVLASSRGENIRDDRGNMWVKTISLLSCYQLRTHYLIYQAINNAFKDSDDIPFTSQNRQSLKVFFKRQDYIAFMDFNNDENENYFSLLSHSLFGLHDSSLVNDCSYGLPADIKNYQKIEVSDEGFVVIPSLSGAELFLWANGKGKTQPSRFLSTPVNISKNINVFPHFIIYKDNSQLYSC